MFVFVVKKYAAGDTIGKEVYLDTDKARCLKKAAILASKEFPSYSGEIWKKGDTLLAWSHKGELVRFQVLASASIDEAE